jgi:hypothetical protein
MINKSEAANPVPQLRAAQKPSDAYGYQTTADTLKCLEQKARARLSL